MCGINGFNFLDKSLTARMKKLARSMKLDYPKWLKGPLNAFVKGILSKDYYSNSKKYLNFDNTQKMLVKHRNEYYNPALIWSLINLQLSLIKFKL